MNANVLLKFAIPLLVFLVFAGFFTFSGEKKAVATTGKVEELPVATISKKEATVLGVEGDTRDDTIATIVGQMRDMKKSVDRLTQQNEQLRAENQRLQSREELTDRKIEEQLKKATEKVAALGEQAVKKAEEPVNEIQKKLEALAQLKEMEKDKEELPSGLGLEEGDGDEFAGNGLLSFKIGKASAKTKSKTAKTPGNKATVVVQPAPSVVWIEPLDVQKGTAQGAKPGQPSFPLPTAALKTAALPFTAAADAIESGRRDLNNDQSLGKVKNRNANSKPFYTIAQNATLMGSTGMTALIGRTPVEGAVNDPYPFKILVGKDNLMASGVDLPEVAAAVMSGTATGDWLLSCVRGRIDSMTFVFEDGTIRTVPEPGQGKKTGSGGLGYLSDQYGIPCVHGLRRSNAKEYLTTNALFTTASAFLSDYFGGDSSSISNNGTTTYEGNSALQEILTGGFEDVRKWNERLNGQAFAAVYVAPGSKVAVHIEQEIAIDYEPNGRKVNYHASNASVNDID